MVADAAGEDPGGNSSTTLHLNISAAAEELVSPNWSFTDQSLI